MENTPVTLPLPINLVNILISVAVYAKLHAKMFCSILIAVEKESLVGKFVGMLTLPHECGSCTYGPSLMVLVVGGHAD